MAYTEKDHTWVICAYKESRYLEECVQSLLHQTSRSGIRIATSTPNGYIAGIAERYGLEVFVNRGKAGISGDWNFALDTAETELVTIAHQDDVYEPAYTGEMLARMNRARDAILYFTDYGELRNGERVTKNRLLRIKRLLLVPTRMMPAWKFARRLSLAFGDPICCPSITYRKSVMKDCRFSDRFRCDLDWEMEEKLSRLKGRFVYNPMILMYHRIHEESTTTEIIGEHQRTVEDYEMMKRFWPEAVARRLSKVYASSEKSNRVDQ